MPSRKAGQRSVENLLRGDLHVRIEGGAHLRSDRSRAGHTQGAADEMTCLESGRGPGERPGVAPDLLALSSRNRTALEQSIRQLLDRPARPGSIASQVHT